MGVSARNATADNRVLQLVQRFGIPFGVGDKSIETICQENGVDCTTLLAVVNFAVNGEYQYTPKIDITTLRQYLENAHIYFMDFQLPRIRQLLLEAINLAGADNKVPLLIVRFYDEYVEEIRAHIQHENECAFEHHATDDRHIAAKAIELKNLLHPSFHLLLPHNDKQNQQNQEQNRLLYAVLHDIYHFENELALHCAIEDEILLPALAKNDQTIKTHQLDIPNETEELSVREKEVLVHIVKGLSNKEIADALCLSAHTVMSHRKNIVRKLNIHSIAGLTIYAIVNGIVTLDNFEIL